MLDTCSLPSLLHLKLILPISQVCIYLHEYRSTAYSPGVSGVILCPFSCHLTPALLCIASSILPFEASATIQCLYLSVLHCYVRVINI